MKRKIKLSLLKSKKPAYDVTKTKYSYQQEMDAHFKPLIDELNRVIRFTVPYKHGGFRFRVIIGSDMVPCIMVADVEWDKKFGREIKQICEIFNIKAEFKDWSGFYELYPLDKEVRDPEFDGRMWIERIPYAMDNSKYRRR